MRNERRFLIGLIVLFSLGGCGTPVGSGQSTGTPATPVLTVTPQQSAVQTRSIVPGLPTVWPEARVATRTLPPTVAPQATDDLASPEPHHEPPPGVTDFSDPRTEPLCPPHQPVAKQLEPRLSLDLLKNTEHLINGHGRVLFKDGKARPEGWWTVPRYDPHKPVLWVDGVFYGDVNADGSEDAFVMMEATSGGNHPWLLISVVLNEGGKPNSVAAIEEFNFGWAYAIRVFYGDIQIDATFMEEDGALCCPEGKVRKVFRFCDGELILVSETEL